MRSKPSLPAFVARYAVTSAGVGLVPAIRTRVEATAPPAVTSTVRTPPRLSAIGIAFQDPDAVVAAPVAENASHVSVQRHVCGPDASVSNSNAGQTAAAVIVTTAFGAGF